MSVNSRCCDGKFDFHKKPRTGSITSRKRRQQHRLAPLNMTVTAWKRAGRPA